MNIPLAIGFYFFSPQGTQLFVWSFAPYKDTGGDFKFIFLTQFSWCALWFIKETE